MSEGQCKNRWCLKGDLKDRPTLEQVLAHRFLQTDADEPQERNVKFRSFLCHAQAAASGTVRNVYFALKARGVHTWLDVQAKKLTVVHIAAFLLLNMSSCVMGSRLIKCDHCRRA